MGYCSPCFGTPFLALGFARLIFVCVCGAGFCLGSKFLFLGSWGLVLHVARFYVSFKEADGVDFEHLPYYSGVGLPKLEYKLFKETLSSSIVE